MLTKNEINVDSFTVVLYYYIILLLKINATPPPSTVSFANRIFKLKCCCTARFNLNYNDCIK